MSTTSTFEYTCTLKEDTLALAKQDLNEDPDTRMLELKAFRDRTVQYPGKCDPSRHNMEDFIKAEFLNMSKMIEDEETQVRGFTVVSDYAGVTMSTFLWMQTNLEISKLSIKMWQEWEEYMMSCDKQLEDESKYGFVDYTIGHKVSRKEQDAITNMAGTFRKLNVD
ncbi:hypothetical protein BaRGS_00019564 [Batillaria attramentaria]|uniref:CRAL-TRIO domain-containing protein n=1 Tax=Batillaria attramentaria TaxID=370345 RepID=A0ABD0KQG3_9CAEN